MTNLGQQKLDVFTSRMNGFQKDLMFDSKLALLCARLK
jgi:hypothetical protein